MNTSTLLTVEEVANRLKCHPQTVRRWIWSGELGHVKVGGLVRVPEEAIQHLAESGAQRSERARQRGGVDALRATMQTLRARVSREDMEELKRKLSEGEQPADWGSPID